MSKNEYWIDMEYYDVYVNDRFGVSILYPKMWDANYPPQNNDGAVFKHPDEDIEIRVWGSFGMSVMQVDFEEYMKIHIESLEKLDNFRLLTNVESSKYLLVDHTENGQEVKKMITLVGRRLEYSYSIKGKKISVMEFLTSFGTIDYGIRCEAPSRKYNSYKRFFGNIISNFNISPLGYEVRQFFNDSE